MQPVVDELNGAGEEAKKRLNEAASSRDAEAPVVTASKPDANKRRNRKLPRGIFRRGGWFWIRYTDQFGRLHREKASPFLDGAKDALAKRRSEIREGKFFPDKIRQRRVLFGEIARDYLVRVRAKRDWKHDEARLSVLLEDLKDQPIEELTAGRLEMVLSELAAKRGMMPSTHNRYRALLSGVFRHAVRIGNAKSNPVRDTPHRRENNQRVRYLTEIEEAKVLAVIRERCGEREPELLTALHSGMRRSEQFRTAQVPDGGLKWDFIDFQAGVICLPRSKSGKSREIPMNSVLQRVLRSIPRTTTSPYVFEGTDPAKWLQRVCQTAGVRNFRWHDTRHTFASRLVMAGVPIRHVAELMGHSEIQTTMRYAHLAPGQLADAVERLTTVQTDTATDTVQLPVSTCVA
jgi:integrase